MKRLASMALSVGLLAGVTATYAQTGTVVPEDDMPEFCQNAAAVEYEVPLENITTNSPVRREFGLLVEGTVDKMGSTFGFDCRFDPSGAYLGLITQ